MRVKYATQIFSHSVAASMQAAINIGKLDHPHAQLTVDFIKQVDMVFDILNSSTQMSSKKPWKRALKNDDELFQTLDNFLEVLRTSYFERQRGAISIPKVYFLDMLKQTINGVKIISSTCNRKGLENLHTRRLGTDSVENYFSQVKRCFKYVTPRSFQSFFRASMILKSFSVRGSNCEDDDDANFLCFSDDSNGRESTLTYDTDLSEEESELV